MWNIFPNFQTAWLQWLWRLPWSCRGCRYLQYPGDNISGWQFDVEWCRCLWWYNGVEFLWGTGLICWITLIESLLWCSWFPWCVESIGISHYILSVQPNHHATMSWPTSFTGSKYALCIHLRALELSIKSMAWAPCTSFYIFMYIDTAESRNSSRFSVSTQCHLGGMYQQHAMNLSLYPMIPYLQASDHSVTVGFVNIMLFIGTPLFMSHRRIFIQRCRSCLCQDWSSCGPHLFPLLEICVVDSGSNLLVLWFVKHD